VEARAALKMQIKKLGSNNKTGIMVALILIAIAIFSRLIPHPANFAPIAAVAIFGGAVLPRKLALSLPLVAMILSDFVIGLHPLIFFTWGSFALIALISSYKFKNITLYNVVGGSIGASVLFYLVTNFAVWTEGRLYQLTFSGLMQCYYNALPFFRNTLLGDMVFTSSLFGLYAFSQLLVKNSQKKHYLPL
jgi:hypothetical protein